MGSENQHGIFHHHGAVKLVEDDDFQNQNVSTFDTDMMHLKWANFKETGNPVLALEAFMLAIKGGVYPPAETLRWMEAAFSKWHDSVGKESLDSALGMSVGKGQVPFFKRLLIEHRDENLLLDMDRLTALGATIEHAAALVEKKLSDADWNKTPYDIADISAETLIRKYSNCGFRLCFSKEKPPLNDRAWVSQWLKTFDVSYMTESLKSML